MTVSLIEAVHRETDELYLLQRLYNSAKAIVHGHSWSIIATTAICGTVSISYLAAFSVFCTKGTVMAFEKLHDRFESNNTLAGLRPLGDAGGWTMLTLFAVMSIEAIFIKFIREGEYLKLKSICKKWLKDHATTIQSDPKLHQNLYEQLNKTFDAQNAHRLFLENIFARRLRTMKLIEKSGIPDLGSDLSIHRRLENGFQLIDNDVKKKTSASNYFSRCLEGIKAVKQNSCLGAAVNLIKGIALPLIFTGTAVISYIGEFGLGIDLYQLYQDQDDVGHFGEWPFNGIEAFGYAFLLHSWSILTEGDFALTRNIYDIAITALQNDIPAYNALCKLANEDLAQQSSNCQYVRQPLDYDFKEL